MQFEQLTPMLRTRDLAGTLAFYQDVLGFTCDASSEEWGWASLSRDGVNIMVALPYAHEPSDRPVFTGSFYLRVSENVEALSNDLKDRARVCYELETFDYGMREFAIYDNNGYLLQFGQAV
jgi:uncharacterized glyoxalase superfamily protein PhnB